jgi:mRNA interferase MazF
VRGDLYRLRRDKSATGHEQAGPRFAVAVQSDVIRLSTLIVAPTSTRAQPAVFRPAIDVSGTTTRILVDQMRAVDSSRLGDHAGRLDAEELDELDRAVRLVLGIL